METLTLQMESTLAKSTQVAHSIHLLPAADNERAREVLPPRLLATLETLHRELESERKTLLQARQARQAKIDQGEVPSFLAEHPAHHEDWKVAPIPEDLLERRVEITGPASSAKMVIQMLNGLPGGGPADMAMLDFEDSMKPTWSNVIDAIHNVIGAVKGDLTFTQIPMADMPLKTYTLNPSNLAHVMVRVRGLHMQESHVTVDGAPVSAGLFDLVACAFNTADLMARDFKTPKYYVPKCEHYLEARWWNRAFARLEQELELPPGTLRVTFLIETLPAAFQMEEILYEIRSRACGLNGGRWDKIFSDIKVLRNHPNRVLADRASIDMKSPWMDAYAKLLIKTCHKHGAFAMGGMAAFTPGKSEELRRTQTEKVRADKAREASIGHDGCWVSHPYFIPIARAEFKQHNQLDVLLKDFPEHPDLLPQPVGPKTLQGLRTNVRVGIGYMAGWMSGQGCVALDNLMEDLATLEISRAQTWQWLHHGIKLDDGTRVTRALVEQTFDEELARLMSEEPNPDYKAAAQAARELFLQPKLKDFLGDAS